MDARALGAGAPLQAPGRRYDSYAAALAAIERPRLLENRVTYRLLSASLAGPAPCLELTRGRYFDWVNGGEAIAHELAEAWREDPDNLSPERLPIRALLGRPWACHSACPGPGIAFTSRMTNPAWDRSFSISRRVKKRRGV